MKFAIFKNKHDNNPIFFNKVREVADYLNISIRGLQKRMRNNKHKGDIVKRFKNSEYEDYLLSGNEQKGGRKNRNLDLDFPTDSDTSESEKEESIDEKLYEELELEESLGTDTEESGELEESEESEESELEEDYKETTRKGAKIREYKENIKQSTLNKIRYDLQEAAKKEQEEEAKRKEKERLNVVGDQKPSKDLNWNFCVGGVLVDTVEKLNKYKDVFIGILDNSGIYSDKVLDIFRNSEIVDVYYNPEPKRYVIALKSDDRFNYYNNSYLLPYTRNRDFEDYKSIKYNPVSRCGGQYSLRNHRYFIS